MWIIPSNHPLYSVYAPECVASKGELSEFSDQLEQSLMWKSRLLSSKIWSAKWNKVYWLPHLFGRMLKPSHSKHFTESYTGSLADIHASHSPTLDYAKVQLILDTFGRSLRTALKNRGLLAFGSRMSKDTYRLVSGTYARTYENWVTKLRLEYSQRQRSEPHTEETGFLFSGWKTPSSSECEGGTMSKGRIGNAKYKLRDQVSWPTPDTFDKGESNINQKSNKKNAPKNFYEGINWQTPVASRGEYQKQKDGSSKNKLMGQVKEVWPTPTSVNRVRDEETMQKCADFRKKNHQNTVPLYLAEMVNLTEFPTPSARDWRSGKSNQHQKNSRPLNEVIVLTDSQPVQGNYNMNGKRLGLNPAWVMQLMGTTIEKTFFAWQEMQLSNNKPKSPSEPS
jgi:hypothetical protein